MRYRITPQRQPLIHPPSPAGWEDLELSSPGAYYSARGVGIEANRRVVAIVAWNRETAGGRIVGWWGSKRHGYAIRRFSIWHTSTAKAVGPKYQSLVLRGGPI